MPQETAATCPLCFAQHTIRTANAALHPVHFCLDCGKTFVVTSPPDTTRPTREIVKHSLVDLSIGDAVALSCGCQGTRRGERAGLIGVSVARACDSHPLAMHEGLWVTPRTRVRRHADDPPLQLGLNVTRDPAHRRVNVSAEPDGTTNAHCLEMVRQRANDGTWQFGTLVEGNAMPPSPADAWLLAEFTAAMVQTHGPRGPMAIVAPDDGQFAVAKMYAEQSVAPAPRPFRARNEAASWLHAQGY